MTMVSQTAVLTRTISKSFGNSNNKCTNLPKLKYSIKYHNGSIQWFSFTSIQNMHRKVSPEQKKDFLTDIFKENGYNRNMLININ